MVSVDTKASIGPMPRAWRTWLYRDAVACNTVHASKGFAGSRLHIASEVAIQDTHARAIGSVADLGKHDVREAWRGALAVPVPLEFAGQLDPADGDAAGLDDALQSRVMCLP
jgi:hypothetical protein